MYSFKETIDPNEDIFLNFNYTTTLESLYEAQNVTHIHGCRNNCDELIIGHNNDSEYKEEAYHQDILEKNSKRIAERCRILPIK